jgi:hypothetical protein
LWTDYFGLTPASSFLPVAVIFDLISYLRASGHLEHPRASNADPAVPLLHYTIPRKRCSNLLFNAYNLSNLKPRTVKLLLEAKESPNLPCPEVSPYQQALNFADHLCQSYEEKLKAFDILATMLYFGADPRVSGDVGQHIYLFVPLKWYMEQSGPGARNTYSTVCSLGLLTVVVLLK